MKRCLVDVNVWLALLVRSHTHHRLARKWFHSLKPGEAMLCRGVQLSLIRLLANPSIMAGGALTAAAAWNIVEELLRDERVEFVAEPATLGDFLPPLLRYATPAGKLINDAYLAAFALSGGCRMVTLDAGFRQFHGLDMELLRG